MSIYVRRVSGIVNVGNDIEDSFVYFLEKLCFFDSHFDNSQFIEQHQINWQLRKLLFVNSKKFTSWISSKSICCLTFFSQKCALKLFFLLRNAFRSFTSVNLRSLPNFLPNRNRFKVKRRTKSILYIIMLLNSEENAQQITLSNLNCKSQTKVRMSSILYRHDYSRFKCVCVYSKPNTWGVAL